MLSPRIKCLMQEASPIMQGHLTCATDPFTKENPNGYLNFGIAENHLMSDWTVEFVNKGDIVQAEDLQYFELSGLKDLREVIVNFFESYLHTPRLNPNNVVVMNGLSSVCEAISYTMFSKGDFVMMPSPYYSGFDFDFKKRFGVEFLNVPLKPENHFKHSIEDFICSYEKFEFKSKVKAILITHPHNPTGEVINKVFLRQIIEFAKEKKLEIITDEIYALTNFTKMPHNSLLAMAGDYKEHVHLLYGLAKDFTLAGMKVGIFYSENKDLVQAMKLLSYFHCTSSLTQRFTQRLLADHNYITKFMNENNQRLLAIKNKIKTELPSLKIIDGDSGLFFLVDLSSFLTEPTFDAEKKLYRELLDKYKIFLTSGGDMSMSIPGYFRLCFSKKIDEVNELIIRLKKFFKDQANK
ncbi:MAG: pyridoxal phosphate-dependent aminotransferase [Bdellovibrionales bacterium]|nr:pyridoxal phosphate-dependent aminotransferase [Bdellovibrionales bacterium]